MTAMILVLLGTTALLGMLVRLARLVAQDGLGSTPPPRSHGAELGFGADRELSR